MTGFTLETLAARASISDALARYCHGIDRCDAETLASAYWPEAIDDHGSGPVPVAEFIDRVIPALKAMTATMHAISNMMIEIDGDRARVETYCTAYHQIPGEDGRARVEMVVGGRYLDRFERRGKDWRIIERVYVMDWNRNAPSSQELAGGLYDTLLVRGARHPDDPWDGFQRS